MLAQYRGWSWPRVRPSVCLSVQCRHVSNALGRCIKIRRNRGSRVSGCSPNFWGGGAVLPQKFVDAVVEWRWWLFTGGNHQHSFVYALYQINTRSSPIAEGPRDASCPLKSCQLLRNSAETTYTTSPDQIDGMKLEIFLETMPERQCALNHDANESLSLSQMCHKQTDHGRLVDITSIPTTCCGEIF